MNPKDYTGKEFDDLLRGMNSRGIKMSMKRAVRAESKKALGIARNTLESSSIHAKGRTWKPTKKHPDYEGDTSDWEKAVREHIYSDRYGLGFLITVKAHRATKKQMAAGNPGKGMHKRRNGFYKPVLMFAEEGTVSRQRKARRVKANDAHNTAKAKGRIGGRWHYTRKGGIPTGRMPAYRFLEKATPEMFREVESGLKPEVENAVYRVAEKYGFTG